MERRRESMAQLELREKAHAGAIDQELSKDCRSTTAFEAGDELA